MKRLLAVGFFIIVTFSAFGQSINLSIASLEPVGAPTTLAVEYMAKLVSERSNGQIRINPNPGGSLGTGLQIMESVSLGMVDMVSMVLEWYAPFVKDINVYVMGFTFRDESHFRKFLASPIFEDMKKQVLDKMGVRIIADNWVGMPRVVVSKKPIKSPADIANIKMRVPEIDTYIKVWKALGTSPTRIAWAEVYLALKTGVVDAAEGPLDQMYATKFYEAAPYITLTNHLQQVFTIGINEAKFKSLPKSIQDMLVQAALDAGEYYQDYIRKQFEIDKAKMIAEGAIFNEIDTVPFQKMLAPVISECESTGFWSKGLYQRIQDIK